MAKPKANQTEPALVIVESPAKAKTIGKFLGSGYVVEASVGHIRDLPANAREVPVKDKKKPWGRLGIDVDSDFKPSYIIPSDKKKQVAKLESCLAKASSLYLATDEDREGEAISWHLKEVLKPESKKIPFKRLVFHEITKNAIFNALEKTRDLDMDLVRAQETRRILDRLYGYEISPILWRKVKNNLSAGRVQSVAVRLLVDRERERIAFHSAEYWDVLGEFSAVDSRKFQASLVSVDNKPIPSGKDFDPSNGNLKSPEKFSLLNEKAALELVAKLDQSNAVVESVDENPYVARPYPPFTTSALQQEANRKLRFTARRTMNAAQSLYENGLITYMRTDSTNLSVEAISAARALVREHYGDEYLPNKPRFYETKVKNAQEAHEAIRPAGAQFPFPEELHSRLNEDEYRLYDLIWKRTIASQMTDARGKRKTIVVRIDNALFQVGGKTIVFPGYLRAYVEGKDDPDAELADQERILPDVKQGDALNTIELVPQSHATQPPQRYSEAALTKTLEDKGIGRPSTYASIIDVILNRNYAFKKNGALVPTWTAFAVCQLLEKNFPELVDYDFTADMENALDEISNGKRDEISYLRAFYFGEKENSIGENDEKTFPFPPSFSSGLKRQIDAKQNEIDPRDVCQFLIGTSINEDNSKENVYVRVGRYGVILDWGGVHASIPDDLPPDELTLVKALELLNAVKRANLPLGYDETGKPIYLKNGRFGWYVQCGDFREDSKSKEDKPKCASLLKGMSKDDVTLDVAMRLLSLPRTLGVDAKSGEPIIASSGRFGAYVKRGTETRSIPENISLLNITLEEALNLLSQPKLSRSRTTRRSEPLRIVGVSDASGREIKLFNGRYGLYVSDGDTNASLPKNMSQEDLSLEKAEELIANRIAKGKPSRKHSKRPTRAKSLGSSSASVSVKKKSPEKKNSAKKARGSSIDSTSKELGTHPDSGSPVVLSRTETNGWSVKCDKGTKKKSSKLPTGLSDGDVDLNFALKLLNLPINLGVDDKTRKQVSIDRGKFANSNALFIESDGKKCKLQDVKSLTTIDLADALKLLYRKE